MNTNWELFCTIVATWEDAIVENIDEEFDGLVQHLHDCVKNAKSWKATNRCLSSETLMLIHQCSLARAWGNHMPTSKLTKLCREAIKEDPKDRRAAVLANAAEARTSIPNTRLSFANCKTKMTALRCPDGSITSSRRAMERIIHDLFFSFPNFLLVGLRISTQTFQFVHNF